MRRIAAFALAAFIAVAPLASFAQITPSGSAPVASSVPQVSAPAPTPPANTFVTVKDGSATISGGTIVGELIMWLVLVIGAPLAGFVVALIVKLLKKFGVETSDADRARLKEMIENGIALAAQRAEKTLDGKLPIEVKNKLAVQTLAYVQTHGADTLKRLGYDPTDPKAIEAIQARIAKMFSDKETSMGTVNVTTQAS
jgi:hypothetical protein